MSSLPPKYVKTKAFPPIWRTDGACLPPTPTQKAESLALQGVGENGNAGNNESLMSKIEDFVQNCNFGFQIFTLAGFWVFANFGPGLRVLVPPWPASDFL